MAIFPKEETETKSMETIIGSSIKVEGNFNGKGNVTVEGEVAGSLRTSKNLKVGQGAKIKAEVVAASVYLAGEVRGNIKATEKIELTNTAKLVGNIETKNITIAPGAYFTGKCQMITEEGTQEVVESPKPNNRHRNNKLGKK